MTSHEVVPIPYEDVQVRLGEADKETLHRIHVHDVKRSSNSQSSSDGGRGIIRRPK